MTTFSSKKCLHDYEEDTVERKMERGDEDREEFHARAGGWTRASLGPPPNHPWKLSECGAQHEEG